MHEIYVNILGIIAGMCTSLSFIPQIIKIARTKKVRDISLGMFVVLGTGIFLWFVYGILMGAFPVILANGVSFLLCMFVVGSKLKYGE